MKKILGYIAVLVAATGVLIAGAEPEAGVWPYWPIIIGGSMMAGGGLTAFLCFRERPRPLPFDFAAELPRRPVIARKATVPFKAGMPGRR